MLLFMVNIFKLNKIKSKLTENYHILIEMTDHHQCNYVCGTKICLDQQLIDQRQEWKQKYFCFQRQTSKDIGLLKQKIYQQCSIIMQNQFNRKQKEHVEQINKKNIDIQQLTSKIIKIQSSYKISQKQKQVLTQRLTEQQQRFNQKLDEIRALKQKHVKSFNQMQEQNFSETGLLRTKFMNENEEFSNRVTTENNVLKQKIKQFQRKYLRIIPEVEKLKHSQMKKNQEILSLENQLEKLKQTQGKQNQEWKIKLQNAQSLHFPCQSKIFKINQRITELENQLVRAKNIKKQVKVEPVYIDRPVEVERVVEKIIQVQRIVKQYIEPQIPVSYKQYEQENRRLNDELHNIIYELQNFQTKYSQLLRQHTETVQELELNINKYKAERENLVKKIHEQDEELEKIYNLMMVDKESNGYTQNQKIVVFVNKDGSYNKRVEKIDITEKVNVQKSVANLHATGANVKGRQASIGNSRPTTLKEISNNKHSKTNILRKK